MGGKHRDTDATWERKNLSQRSLCHFKPAIPINQERRVEDRISKLKPRVGKREMISSKISKRGNLWTVMMGETDEKTWEAGGQQVEEGGSKRKTTVQ